MLANQGEQQMLLLELQGHYIIGRKFVLVLLVKVDIDEARSEPVHEELEQYYGCVAETINMNREMNYLGLTKNTFLRIARTLFVRRFVIVIAKHPYDHFTWITHSLIFVRKTMT